MNSSCKIRMRNQIFLGRLKLVRQKGGAVQGEREDAKATRHWEGGLVGTTRDVPPGRCCLSGSRLGEKVHK